MSFTKQFKTFSLVGVFMLIQGITFCQVQDTTQLEEATSDIYFEKIVKDGEVSYLSKRTNAIISESTYNFLCGPALEDVGSGGEAFELANFSYENWDTSVVNPFVGVALPTPFKLEFDQDTFVYPVDIGIRITSRFGVRRRGYHRGLDIDLVTGDTVRSVLPGKVRFVGYSRGHGKTVVVRHANEVETLYAHLSGHIAKTGDVIPAGAAIGLGGNTGRSYGSHLHLEVRYKGRCIHPEYVFNFDDDSKSIRGDGATLWVNKSWTSPRDHSAYRKSKLKPLLSPEAAVAAQNALPKYYKVRKGDTLSHIAQRYGMRIREICSLNSITTSSILRIGQTLKIR